MSENPKKDISSQNYLFYSASDKSDTEKEKAIHNNKVHKKQTSQIKHDTAIKKEKEPKIVVNPKPKQSEYINNNLPVGKQSIDIYTKPKNQKKKININNSDSSLSNNNFPIESENKYIPPINNDFKKSEKEQKLKSSSSNISNSNFTPEHNISNNESNDKKNYINPFYKFSQRNLKDHLLGKNLQSRQSFITNKTINDINSNGSINDNNNICNNLEYFQNNYKHNKKTTNNQKKESIKDNIKKNQAKQGTIQVSERINFCIPSKQQCGHKNEYCINCGRPKKRMNNNKSKCCTCVINCCNNKCNIF